MHRLVCILLLVSWLVSCNEDANPNAFVVRTAEETGLDFANRLGITLDLNILNYMYFYNGGGLAVADLNNDGLQDVIFSSNLESEKVFINKGGLQFEDVSEQTGIDGGSHSWTNGVALADVNGDGLVDVYLSQVGKFRNLDSSNKLFICASIDESGIPRYTEQSEQYGLDFKGFSTQAGFFDYDLDGDLDLYLMNHSLHHNGTFGQRPSFVNSYDSLSGDRLYRNDNGFFTDVTRSCGINSSVIGYGLGMAFSDVNLDGYPDIYIGNDFHENDYLYINNGNGGFSEVIQDQMMHTSRFSMGVDIADINGDRYTDVVSLDMLPEDPLILKSSEGENDLDVFNFKLGYGYNHQYAKNALQLNNGNGSFSELAMMAGVHATDWSWSPLIFDMNMDGLNDLFVSNGLPKRTNDIDYIDFISSSEVQYKIRFDQLSESDLEVIDKAPEIKLKNKLYLNGGDLKFTDIGNKVANDRESYSNSAAYADFDNDGDYDILCNNINEEAFLYDNITGSRGVRIKLKGDSLNTHAIGSKLIIYKSNGEIQLLENFSTRGFQASSINDFLFSPSIKHDSIILVWPDNRYQNLGAVIQDTILRFSKTLPLFDYSRLAFNGDYIIEELASDYGLDYMHTENPFIEFKREPLIPHSSSTEGPALTVADFDGDGLEDVFVGSAKRRWNIVFRQSTDGKFEPLGDIGIDSTYEEVDALAADFNGNGLLDLVIATGGNEFAYTNDYTSQLIVYDVLSPERRVEKLPLNMTASCVDASDFDGDGDLDLFFGARARVSSYGAEVLSSILVNEGDGNFEIYPDNYIPELESMGMVKDGMWIDFDQDGDDDLLIAVEWEGIHLFTNENGTFSHQEIIDKKGWWNTIEARDLDGDGDLDILAGNIGLNSRLKASEAQPVRMYYNDFDNNGTKEQILSYYLEGREIPFNNFKELKSQIPSIKKQYLFARDFAQADIRDLFGMEKINNSKVFTLDFMESAVFENLGNHRFRTHILPVEMQISTINNFAFDDFNGDGLVDILATGNYYDCNIQMARYDASYGHIAINKGNCEFEYKDIQGHKIKNQVRRSSWIELADKTQALVLAKNDDKLEMVKINRKQ